MITLTWKTSVLASAIHAAREIIKRAASESQQKFTEHQKLTQEPNRRDPLTFLPTHDLDSRNVFIESAATLTANFVSRRKFPADNYWHRILEQACSGLPHHLLETSLDADADLLRELEASYRRMYPKIDEQLLLRARPIQESWTGFGRGLMAHTKRLTQPDWIVPDTTAVLVQPIRGGDGVAFPKSKIFLVEAMLTNASPELPEVLRVAWLASQMNAGLLSGEKLVDSEELTPAQQSQSLAIAMMMCTLAAGEVMELCRCDEATATKALELWGIDPAESNRDTRDDKNDLTAKTAITWWETYLQTRPVIGVSLVALNKMLQRNED